MSALKDRPPAGTDTEEVTMRVQGVIPDELREAIGRVAVPADVLRPILQSVQAFRDLAPAMEASKFTASPQMARSLQARENWLRSIEEEFGTLSRQEVAELRGSKGANRSMAADLQSKGQILAFRRGNSFRIPQFQFTEAGHIRPALPRLIAAATDAGWDDQDLLVWLTNPNRHFPEGKRPVDCLDDVDRILEVFTATVEEQ